MRLAHRFDVGRVTQSPLGNARALKSCSSVMQQSVSIRRPLLVSNRYVLVNIILDTSLEYGGPPPGAYRPRAGSRHLPGPMNKHLRGEGELKRLCKEVEWKEGDWYD